MRYSGRMLAIGDRVPSFSATTTDGSVVGLTECRGKPLVLFFFPKAFTFG